MKHNNTYVFNRLSHTLLAISILTAFTFQVKAQNPIELMNAELRHLFSNLNNPNPDVRFLYDMSAKVTDSIFYTDISYDTSIVDNWYNLYYEMYNAAYDTTLFITQDSIFQNSFPKVLNDTIPIGILHWKYNKLKPGALDTNLYFSFDTINNVVYDLVPQPITPYVIESIFAASPLTREVTFANLTFQVTPDLFFKDPTTIYDPDNRILKIDFDDGNGWVEFDPYIVESGFEIDLNKSNMQTGMYIIKISTKNEVLSKKFVVQP